MMAALRPNGCPTALVVDDDIEVQHIIEDVLTEAGFDVTCAPNGALALDQVEEAEPDVIVLDLDMPVMDGPEFFRVLRATGNVTPVIVLSAAGNPRRLREVGAEDSMAKPFDIDELAEHVRALVVKDARPAT